MGRKRKRPLGEEEDATVGDSSPPPQEPPSKRRRSAVVDPSDLFHEVFDVIRNYKDETGRVLCEAFIRVPKRRNMPEYYDVVSQPIDLLKIQQRLKTDEYNTLDSFTSQMELLFTNAKAFYSGTSQEYKDADALLEILWSTCQRLFPGGGAPAAGGSVPRKDDAPRTAQVSFSTPAEPPQRQASLPKDATEEDAFQALLNVVLNARDPGTGRSLCEMFMRLPSKMQYPEYYRVITEPMDVRTVTQSLKAGRYSRLKDVKEDLMVIVKNAKHFNEPGSQIYKDAVAIGKEIAAFMDRIAKSHPSFLAPRPSLKVTLKPIAVPVAPESSESSAEEDGGAGEEEYGSDSDMDDDTVSSWSRVPEEKEDLLSLFDTVRKHSSSSGRVLSNVFMRLPSKHIYPQYYEVIKEPLSLLRVQRRLHGNHYPALDSLVKDLVLVFTNAQTFNEPQSRISNDAGKLITLVRKTAAQLKTKSPSGKEGSLRFRFARNPQDGKSPQKSNSQLTERLNSLYQLVVSTKEAGGQQTCADFLQVPSAMQVPDYYRKVLRPIDLQEISSNISAGKYGSPGSFHADLRLLASNARLFYGETSDTYKRGLKLEQLVGKQIELYQQMDGVETAVSTTTTGPVASKTSSPSRQSLSRQGSFDTWQPAKLSEERLRLGDALGIPNSIKVGLAVYKLDSQHYMLSSDVGHFLGLPRGGDISKHHPGLSRRHISEAGERKALVAQGMNASLTQVDLLTPEEVEPLVIAKQGGGKAPRTSPQRSDPAPASGASPVRRGRPPIRSGSPALHGGPLTMRKPGRPPLSKPVATTGSDNESKHALLEIVVTHTDAAGRKLSEVFEELPSKMEYPDYYKVIKKPIDLRTIRRKLNKDIYPTMEELADDLQLMFDNACQYNEPGSVIYKDALQLQNLVLRKKTQLMGEKVGKSKSYGVYPDVFLLVRQLLAKLLQNTLTFEDGQKRCLSQVISKLPEREAQDAHKKLASKAVSLPGIKRTMNEGGYQRLDALQADVFSVCERTRRTYPAGSQTSKDATELQRFFIQCRDELCSQGQVLESPALFYGLPNLEARLAKLSAALKEDGTPTQSVPPATDTKGAPDKKEEEEVVKMEVDPPPQKEPETSAADTDSKSSSDKVSDAPAETTPASTEGVSKTPTGKKQEQQGDSDLTYLDKVTVGSEDYCSGDMVYVQAKEALMNSHIVVVEKLWRDKDGELFIFGNWFYRPSETFHVATRKFLQNEVFKSDYSAPVPASGIVGRCHVMFVKDYFKQQPEGFSEEDVFVCESRYLTRQKQFKKIKVWSVPQSQVKIKQRPIPLPIQRVESVFAAKTSSSAVEMAMQTEQAALSDTSMAVPRARVSSRHIFDGPFTCTRPQNVERAEQNIEEGCKYYEQYMMESGCFKLGDCVYVRSDKEEPFIARIDRMWTDKNGDPWFHGPWFVRPMEVEHPPSRIFYKQEVLMSSIHDTNPMRSILSLCSVLDVPTYMRGRMTHVPEKDVYVCESRYNEADKQIRRLKGLKVFQLSHRSVAEEWYYFSEEISPLKVPSPLLTEETDSAAAAPTPPVKETPVKVAATKSTPASTPAPAPATPATPSISSVTKGRKQASMTGYLLYAGERRRELKLANPHSTFGELSREIGTEWRTMSDEQKAEYEERALALAQAQENATLLQQHGGVEAGQIVVHECRWLGCNHQYEDVQEMANHLLNANESGHIMDGRVAQGEFYCKWSICPRHKRPMPFPSCSKVMRHLREVHLRTCQRVISPSQKSPNFFPHKRLPLSSGTPSLSTPSSSRLATPSRPASTPSSGSTLAARQPAATTVAATPTRPLVPVESLNDGTYPSRMKAVHSHIYSTYVRRLQQGQGQQSSWQDVVSSTPTPTSATAQLPRQWLPGVTDPDQAFQALVTLRQLFVRDAASLSQWTA